VLGSMIGIANEVSVLGDVIVGARFLASAVAPAAEARAWVGIGSRAGPAAWGRTFGPVAGPAGEVWQPEVRVAFGRQVLERANLQ
jgi:hypothetical protein